jgi:hypothetical protein
MKTLFSLMLLASCFISTRVLSQDFVVPTDYKLVAKEDYAPYEKDIIAAAKWLETASYNTNYSQFSEVATFVVKWVNGSPTVNVMITPIIMDLESKNNGMLVLYMAACARYSLENNYSKDMKAQQKAAILSMINAYKTAHGIKKDKKMDKIVKASDEGTLDDWLAKNFK